MKVWSALAGLVVGCRRGVVGVWSAWGFGCWGDAQGPHSPHSQPHKTHGVHTASLTRHTGSTQPAPQENRTLADFFRPPKQSSHVGKTHFFKNMMFFCNFRDWGADGCDCGSNLAKTPQDKSQTE
jgi:hypothetical protein